MKSLESIVWYVHRLRAMKPVELAHRVLEKWRLATEPSFLKSLEGAEAGLAISISPRLPEKSQASERLRAQLKEDAQKLMRGEWQLFGWRVAEVGAPPCWHRDAACGVIIDPDLPARKLNHRKLPDGADARTIWEINRWAEMTRLAMHGWLNDDADALRRAQLWLEDWCDRNPPGMGINWTSPLEVALRLINFTWFDALVEAACREGEMAAVKTAQVALVKRIVPVHAAWIWRYRSAGSSANNHLLGELAALVVAVARWPALAAATCTAEVAWDWMGREILRQFAADGGSKEQALHYHAFAFELAFHAMHSAGCRSGAVHERMGKALHYWQMLGHAEEPWDFGDNDDAQVVPLTLHRALAAEEWRDWAGGKDGALNFWLGSCPFERPMVTSGRFAESGMAVLERQGWKIRLDASPLGFGPLAAHGHGDALHVSVWDGDKALLIDPGTGGYYGHPAARAELAAWEAHNGPLPEDGYATPRRLGVFLWVKHHGPPVLESGPDGFHAAFQHEDHEFQRILRMKDDAVQILDREKGRRPFNLCLTFSPECRVSAAASADDGSRVYTLFREGLRWQLKVLSTDARISISERRVSPAYGRFEQAAVLHIQGVSGDSSILLRRQP